MRLRSEEGYKTFLGGAQHWFEMRIDQGFWRHSVTCCDSVNLVCYAGYVIHFQFTVINNVY